MVQKGSLPCARKSGISAELSAPSVQATNAVADTRRNNIICFFILTSLHRNSLADYLRYLLLHSHSLPYLAKSASLLHLSALLFFAENAAKTALLLLLF